jgi:hypothetical protein
LKVGERSIPEILDFNSVGRCLETKIVVGTLMEGTVEKYDLGIVVVKYFGNRVATPARMAGRQAHRIAAVVSIVDQRVAGTLSHVASMVNPKCRRLLRRIIDVMQTLK